VQRAAEPKLCSAQQNQNYAAESQTMTAPLLSVVIPTLNRAELVCESITSVLNQGVEGIEIIVVDDGSSDNTVSVLHERFGTCITVLCLPRRGGVGAARNAGVRLASGELLAFLDSDDLWLPGKLKAELSVFEQFPDADGVVSDSLFFFDAKPNQRSRFAEIGVLGATQGKTQWQADTAWLWTVCHNGVSISTMTIRRSVQQQLGLPLFAEDLISCEDWELEIQLYQHCRMIMMPQVLTHIRCIDDGSRIGRACPGSKPNNEQQKRLFQDRLTTMKRSINVEQLNNPLKKAYERYRDANLNSLNRLLKME
jgi:glycosyltransferase involved in cell wall biosynthesis